MSVAIKSVLYCRDHHKGHHQILHLAWGWCCNYISAARLRLLHLNLYTAQKSAKDHWPPRTIAFSRCVVSNDHTDGILEVCSTNSKCLHSGLSLFLSCTIPSPNTLHRRAIFFCTDPLWEVFSGGSKWNRLRWTSACNQEPLWGGREELRLRCGALPTPSYKAEHGRGKLAWSYILMQSF